ncbi:MAG: 2-hydroxychromene-2-carboxylate isomerase [Alphaproteobacteria bacterium]|nr:2-hydroxychromene-2-carboxylate isomerase [Alphaproteobacteria bacterium]
MSERHIDYYLSLMSPWTYLGARRLEEMAARHGVAIRVKPVDFGRIFPASGGLPLAKRAPQRQAYRFVELARWRDHLGLPLVLRPKHFPLAESLIARCVVAARQSNGQAAALGFAHACLRGLWAEDRNTADPEILREIAGACGLDGARLLEAAESAETKAAYDADTAEALERGVFGAPSYVLDGEIFWGQDRLDFLERALARTGRE